MKKTLIAIPSYGRAETVNIFKSLANNYKEYEDVADIRGFVTKLQKGQYSRCNPDTEFIVRPEWAEKDIGLCRKFIVEWAQEQGYEFVLQLDDDVEWVRTAIRGKDIADTSHIKEIKTKLGLDLDAPVEDIKEVLFWDPDKARFRTFRGPKATRSMIDRETILKLEELGKDHCMLGPGPQNKVYARFEPFVKRGQVTQVVFLNIKRMKEKDVNFAAFEEHGVEDLYLGYQLLLKGECPKYTNIVICLAEEMGSGRGGWNAINDNLNDRLQKMIDIFVANAQEHPEYYEVSKAQSGAPSIKFAWKNIPEEFV